jgi:hypothetical protein
VCYACYQGYYPSKLFGPISIKLTNCDNGLVPRTDGPGNYDDATNPSIPYVNSAAKVNLSPLGYTEFFTHSNPTDCPLDSTKDCEMRSATSGSCNSETGSKVAMDKTSTPSY